MTKLTITAEFPIGTAVFPKASPEDHAGTVTGFVVRPLGLAYLVSWDDLEERSHYATELTDTKFKPAA